MHLKCDLCMGALNPSTIHRLTNNLGKVTHLLCIKCYGLVEVFIAVSKFKGSK